MTRRHLLVIQLALGALLGLTIARALPPAPGAPRPCAHPSVVVSDGRELLRCGSHGATPSRRRVDGARRLLLGLPIDVNRASVADLMLLPRVGPVLARRIVAQRRAGGLFRSVEELQRVKGIGPVTVRRLRGIVCATRPAGGCDAAGRSAAAPGG